MSLRPLSLMQVLPASFAPMGMNSYSAMMWLVRSTAIDLRFIQSSTGRTSSLPSGPCDSCAVGDDVSARNMVWAAATDLRQQLTSRKNLFCLLRASLARERPQELVAEPFGLWKR